LKALEVSLERHLKCVSEERGKKDNGSEALGRILRVDQGSDIKRLGGMNERKREVHA